MIVTADNDNNPDDLIITGWGSFDQIQGVTVAGRDWLSGHFDWQPSDEPAGLPLLHQTGVAVNHSDIQDIIGTAEQDGLKVRVNNDDDVLH